MSYNVNNPPKSDHIDFVGKRVAAAKNAGVIWRVARRDGVGQIGTRDARFDRYNFEIEDGIIVKQYMG
jgi:hypothetical protein